MKISIYTFVKNGLYLDYHVVDMLKHHVPYADEIIVNEGYSSDGTYEKIKDIDPKIKIIRSEWDNSDPTSWSRKFKDFTRKHCTGDWCILLDCDEFIPEWEFDRIRNFVVDTDKDIIPMRYINFYGNYKVYNANPEKHKWPAIKNTIHRNIEGLEVWGDGSNVRFKEGDEPSRYETKTFECHHFGFVRHAARLRNKWHNQRRRNIGKNALKFLPRFLFELFPHKWEDPDFASDLAIYNGPFVAAIQRNPDEFVRDKYYLYHLLKSRHGEAAPML